MRNLDILDSRQKLSVYAQAGVLPGGGLQALLGEPEGQAVIAPSQATNAEDL
jgi:hypothetical protein